MFWEIIPFGINRIKLVKVKGSTKRVKPIILLDPAQVWLLIDALDEPYSIMVLIAASLGLRIEEIAALQCGSISTSWRRWPHPEGLHARRSERGKDGVLRCEAADSRPAGRRTRAVQTVDGESPALSGVSGGQDALDGHPVAGPYPDGRREACASRCGADQLRTPKARERKAPFAPIAIPRPHSSAYVVGDCDGVSNRPGLGGGSLDRGRRAVLHQRPVACRRAEVGGEGVGRSAEAGGNGAERNAGRRVVVGRGLGNRRARSPTLGNRPRCRGSHRSGRTRTPSRCDRTVTQDSPRPAINISVR